MKKRLGDLDNHLFAALERLSAEDLSEDKIAAEVARADAIVSIADQILEGAKVKLTAAKLFAEHGGAIKEMLPQIGKSE